MKALAIAHRGLHKKYFENTVEAFEAAGKGPYYGIETDIHLTKDNVWVIHHDPDFLSGGVKYTIKDLTWDELKDLPLDNDMGHADAKCPLLEPYLKICKESGKRPIIEIKPKDVSFGRLGKLVKYLDSYIGRGNYTVIAFYPWPLIRLRLMYGRKIHLQQLVLPKMFLTGWALLFGMDLDIEHSKLTEEIVGRFHKKNLKVNVWTVDDDEALKKSEAMNVDFITSNMLDQNS